MDVLRQGAKVGQPIILFRTSNTDPAEDSSRPSRARRLTSSRRAWCPPRWRCTTAARAARPTTTRNNPTGPFVNDPAFELEYAPFGVDSGLCAGVAATARAKEGVTLQPCGVSAKTVWIADTNDPRPPWSGYVPLINGSDTNFSHPFVLTYPGNGFPTEKPRPQLFTSNLTGFSHGRGTPIGSVNDTQLWGADFGVLR